MKKIINYAKSHPLLFVFFILLLLYLPSAIVSPAESEKFAIVNTIGLDYNNDQYEISTLIHVPQENLGFEDTYKLVSASGNDITTALKNLELHVGKQLGLIHTTLLVCSSKIVELNLTNALDYFARTTELANNTNLVYTENSAKEILEASLSVYKSSGIKLNDIIDYNQSTNLATIENIETYYKTLFLPTSSSLLNKVDVTDTLSQGLELEENQTQSSSENSGENGGSNSSQSNNKKVLSNSPTSIVLKNGVKIGELTENEIVGLNWVYRDTKGGKLTIDHYTGNGLFDATVIFDVKDKKLFPYVSIKNNIPIINYHIWLTLQVNEIKNTQINQTSLESQKTFLDKNMEKLINRQVSKEFEASFKKLKEYNADILQLNSLAQLNKPLSYQKYLDSLENKEDFLQNFKFNIKTYVIVKK